jgi:hypothetical protein
MAAGTITIGYVSDLIQPQWARKGNESLTALTIGALRTFFAFEPMLFSGEAYIGG